MLRDKRLIVAVDNPSRAVKLGYIRAFSELSLVPVLAQKSQILLALSGATANDAWAHNVFTARPRDGCRERPAHGHEGRRPCERRAIKRTEGQRLARRSSRPDRQAGVGHAKHDGQQSPRSPDTGTGRRVMNAGTAGLAVLRQGRKPARGEAPVPQWFDAQRDSPVPRSGKTLRPTNLLSRPHLADSCS
jgi:hypothetical protein